MTKLSFPLCIEVETEDGHFIIGESEEVKEMLEECQLQIKRVLLCEWTKKESDRAQQSGDTALFLAEKMRCSPYTSRQN